MGLADLHIDEIVDENAINEGAMKILKHIRPTWPQEKILFKLLTDGITNKLVACSYEGAPPNDVVLIRIYGHKTDLLIDRTVEKRNILMLNKVGLASKLYTSFRNGLAYEYIPGCTLNESTVTEEGIFKLVAKHMARMHKVEVPDGEPFIWKKVRDFYALIPNQFTDSNKQERFEKMFEKAVFEREIDFLEDRLSGLESPVVFAHNDLLLGNVIYTKEENKVSFIDFEYAAPNYQAFDIGNHFNEFPGIKDVDYSKYPSKELQMKWLKIYLLEYCGPEAMVTDNDVERLYVQVNQFALISHVFWAIWALIQAEHSYIDYDYLDYANVRMQEYYRRKEEFLSLNYQ